MSHTSDPQYDADMEWFAANRDRLKDPEAWKKQAINRHKYRMRKKRTAYLWQKMYDKPDFFNRS